MKTILLFITLFFASSVCLAEGVTWVSETDRAKLRAQTPIGVTYHPSEIVCEQKSGEECWDCGANDCRVVDVQTSMVDDQTKPIYKAKYDLSNCDSDVDCTQKQDSKNCNQGDYSTYEKNSPPIPGFSVYCIGIESYEQKEVKELVENSAVKTSVEASDTAKKQLETDIAARKKRIEFGTRMIAFMGVRNDSKNLTAEQSKTFLVTFGPIMSLMQAGALDTAKSEIEALTPDGTLVTQADKDAILAEINSFLGL